jgi:enterochelin esterase-like enzyme
MKQKPSQQRIQFDARLKLYCGTEGDVFARNERFAAILRKNGVRFDYMRVSGDHTWHYWNSITRHLLISVSDFFTEHNGFMTDRLHPSDPVYAP